MVLEGVLTTYATYRRRASAPHLYPGVKMTASPRFTELTPETALITPDTPPITAKTQTTPVGPLTTPERTGNTQRISEETMGTPTPASPPALPADPGPFTLEEGEEEAVPADPPGEGGPGGRHRSDGADSGCPSDFSFRSSLRSQESDISDLGSPPCGGYYPDPWREPGSYPAPPGEWGWWSGGGGGGGVTSPVVGRTGTLLRARSGEETGTGADLSPATCRRLRSRSVCSEPAPGPPGSGPAAPGAGPGTGWARAGRRTSLQSEPASPGRSRAGAYTNIYSRYWKQDQVPELFTAIREATRAAVRDYQCHLSTNEGKSVDAVVELEETPISGRLFEVMYIGKAKVKDKKGPPTIIDEAVEMFQAEEELQRQRHLQAVLAGSGRRRHESGGSVASLPSNIEKAVSVRENELLSQSRADNDRRNQSNDSRLSGPGAGCGSGAGGGDPVSSLTENNITNGNNGTGASSSPYTSSASTQSSSGLSSDAPTSEESLLDVDTNRNRKEEEEEGDGVSVSSGEEAVAPPGGLGRGSSNRVLLIQVAQYELCLISPDKKTVILERKFKDIAFCFQGIKHPEHFGFNTRDPASGNFVCYVFRCSSKPVVEEIMQALQQAFHSAFEQSVKNHVVCELCPMHQLHKLCQEIEGLPASRVYEILQRRVDQLNEKDYNEIMTGFKAEGLATDQERCEVMMIMLRQVCEAKQREHVHISDTPRTTGKYEFNLMDKSKPSKFDNFKSKAKKSLANSFENLINRNKTKREEARDSFRDRSWTTESDASYTRSFDSAYTPGSTPEVSPCSSPVIKERIVNFPSPPPPPPVVDVRLDSRLSFTRKRSATIGALPDVTQLQATPTPPVNQIPPTDIGHASQHRRSPSPCRRQEEATPTMTSRRTMYERAVGRRRGVTELGVPVVNGNGSDRSRSPTPNLEEATPMATPQRKMSWRLGILNRVVTPARLPDGDRISESPERDSGDRGERSPLPRRRLTSQALRALWRKAILETLLLIRMEKENISLQARQDAAEIKRIKLDYQEIIPCLKDVTKVWEDMLSTPGRPHVRLNHVDIHDAVKAGVPRHQRGDIWRLLVEHDRQRPLGGHVTGPECGTRYEDLLKQLTTQQHAILIDLGRTFPGHPYFARQLGAGQLSLFNLLKAYSLVDKEVGYCQGLSFVAGVLLMHMREDLAFDTLRHLMFQLGFRRQYRPDMVALQIKMYQLSRLLRDMCRDLYDHLERHDIAPTLYAAPWFLTIFASQFPLGFVARVFDLIFLQGAEVVFKVALVLLADHRELIKQCNSFETVVEFLKTTLPSMSIIQMERVINQVFEMDISKDLHAYEVEYHVLQEEMVSSPARGEADVIARLDSANQSLKQQNMELLEQLQTSNSNYHSLEIQLNNLQSSQNKLRSHIRTLEIERAALLQTVAKLRQLVPADVIEAQNIHLPTVFPDVTFTGSPGHTPGHTPAHTPVHTPGLARHIGDPTTKPRGGSMSALDSEVANFTTASSQNGPTSKSPTLWVPMPTKMGRPFSSNN